MTELFSDIFAGRNDALTRLDARAKVIAASSGLLAVLFSRNALLPAGVFAACLLGMVLVRIPARWLSFRLAGPAATALVLVLLHGFTVGVTPMASASFAGIRLTLMEEGVRRGLLLGARVLGGTSVVLLLGAVTPAHRIFHVLRRAGIPAGWVEIAMFTYRYTFVLLEHAAEVSAAQRVRLGYSHLARSMSAIGTLGGTVILRSIDQAVRTHEAMTARGYTGSIPFGPMGAMGRRDRWVAILVSLLFVAAWFLVGRGQG